MPMCSGDHEPIESCDNGLRILSHSVTVTARRITIGLALAGQSCVFSEAFWRRLLWLAPRMPTRPARPARPSLEISGQPRARRPSWTVRDFSGMERGARIAVVMRRTGTWEWERGATHSRHGRVGRSNKWPCRAELYIAQTKQPNVDAVERWVRCP
jgi:hypothetical protein